MGQPDLREKSNKKFMLLSAIGILMVVDHHTWTTFHFFGDYIPYNSFFMPMFVFISGYFNKVDSSSNLWKYFLKKTKTLLLPYTGISLAVFLIQQLMNLYKTGEWTQLPPGYLKYALERVVTVGAFAPIVEPMWFVLSLFATLMVYALLRKLLSKIWNRYLMLGIFLLLHLFVIFWVHHVGAETLHWSLLPLKALFFLPFLEMGALYREKLEKKHEGLSGGWKLGLLLLLLLINLIRTLYLPSAYDVAFDALGELSGFTSPFIVTPLISSVVGILFWLTLVDLIGRPLGESRFVNFLSCNTFWIMGLHIMFFNLLNCVLFTVNKLITVPYFDAGVFSESEWYFWEISPAVKLLYLTVGVLGPLFCKWCFDRFFFFIDSVFFKKM